MLAALAVLLALAPADSLDVRQSALLDAVRAYAGPFDAAWDSTAARVAWVDLNGDGRDDALVALGDSAWCDADGCTVLVFEGLDGEDAEEFGAFRPAAEISGVRLPFHVAEGAGSWCDLVAADAEGHLHRLSFDGETYPFHASAAPVVAEPPSGTVLFAEAE